MMTNLNELLKTGRSHNTESVTYSKIKYNNNLE